jgi:hypothetical protein
MNPRVKAVKPTDDYQLILEFTNGECGLYDCKPLLNFGVFRELQDINYFKQTVVTDGTVTWVNEQDICPDTLYLDSEKMDEISTIWYKLMDDINKGKPCSSEKSLVFHFAWRLKEYYQGNIELDFEKPILCDGNKYLDLYAELNNKKIGFEFKFQGSTNSTDVRISVVHDIKRLCLLKHKEIIHKGYFLYATSGEQARNALNPESNIGRGRKRTEYLDFVTYHLAKYKYTEENKTFPEHEKISPEKVIKPEYDIEFYWENIIKGGDGKYDSPTNKYSWLKPIIIT